MDKIDFPEKPGVTDFKLIVENKPIHVTKAVLMTASPIFTKLFKQQKGSSLEIKGRTYKTFVLFIRCLYPDDHISLNDDVVKAILPLAHEYETPQIIKRCSEYYMHQISSPTEVEISTLISCLSAADKYKMDELYNKAITVLARHNSNNFKREESFDNLSAAIKCKVFMKRVEILEHFCKNNVESDSDDDDDMTESFSNINL